MVWDHVIPCEQHQLTMTTYHDELFFLVVTGGVNLFEGSTGISFDNQVLRWEFGLRLLGGAGKSCTHAASHSEASAPSRRISSTTGADAKAHPNRAHASHTRLQTHQVSEEAALHMYEQILEGCT